MGQGLRSLWDLTIHLTARADDNHAAPLPALKENLESSSFRIRTTGSSSPGKVLRVASN